MPAEDARPERLRSGETVVVRPLRREDGPALAAAVEQLSSQSRYNRFHAGIRRLSREMLSSLIDVDYRDHDALVALHTDDSGEQIVGVARFVRTPERADTAELAVGVADAWHRRGLATLLLRRLSERAARAGIDHFTATGLAENAPTIALLRKLGNAEFTSRGAVLSAQIDPADWAEHAPDSGLLHVPDIPGVLLLPRLLRAWLGLSSELTRTMIFPVAEAVRPRRTQGHLAEGDTGDRTQST
jgi:acetyltransferase